MYLLLEMIFCLFIILKLYLKKKSEDIKEIGQKKKLKKKRKMGVCRTSRKF